jgi:hypothetical protein
MLVYIGRAFGKEMSRTHQAASEACIKFLYHYQKFNQEHLTTLLREQRLYFSDTSSMDDPWDFRPAFDYQPMLMILGNAPPGHTALYKNIL